MVFNVFLHNLWCAARLHSHPGTILSSYQLDIRTCPSHIRIQVGQEAFTNQDNAADSALLVEKSENFGPALQDLQDTTHTMGLNVSRQKTKVQNFRAGPPKPPVEVRVRSWGALMSSSTKQSSNSCSKTGRHSFTTRSRCLLH